VALAYRLIPYGFGLGLARSQAVQYYPPEVKRSLVLPLSVSERPGSPVLVSDQYGTSTQYSTLMSRYHVDVHRRMSSSLEFRSS